MLKRQAGYLLLLGEACVSSKYHKYAFEEITTCFISLYIFFKRELKITLERLTEKSGSWHLENERRPMSRAGRKLWTNEHNLRCAAAMCSVYYSVIKSLCCCFWFQTSNHVLHFFTLAMWRTFIASNKTKCTQLCVLFYCSNIPL